MADRISCPNPRCPMPTDVQLVRSAVESGKAYGGYTTSQTALSAQLSAPPSPTYDATSNAAGINTVLAICGFILAIIIAIPLDGTIRPDQKSIIGTLGCYSGFLVWAVVAIAVSISESGKVAKRRAEYEAKLPAWNKATERWNSAYFCHRCRSTFIPGEPTYVTPENLHALLYR